MITSMLMALVIFASVTSVFSLVISINNYIENAALKHATHTVQMMPAEQIANIPETKENNDWTMDDTEIKSINEVNRDFEPDEFVI